LIKKSWKHVRSKDSVSMKLVSHKKKHNRNLSAMNIFYKIRGNLIWIIDLFSELATKVHLPTGYRIKSRVKQSVQIVDLESQTTQSNQNSFPYMLIVLVQHMSTVEKSDCDGESAQKPLGGIFTRADIFHILFEMGFLIRAKNQFAC